MFEPILNVFPEIEIHEPNIISALVWNGESIVRMDIATFEVTDENIVFTPLFRFLARDNGKLENEIADRVEKYIQSRQNQ